MARLTFIKSEIENLIAVAKRHRNAINLVGEQGVYFATATTKTSPPMCVYAVNCDPASCPADDWWRVKRQTFGPDHGAQPVVLAMLEAWVRRTTGAKLTMTFTNDAMTFVTDSRTNVIDATARSPADIFEVKNDDRAARAHATLKFYADTKGESLQASSAQISDLIADLLHLAAYRGCGPKAVDGIVSLARLQHPAASDEPMEPPAPPSGERNAA